MASPQTNFCPKCGYEYQPWVEVCPDCGAALKKTEPRLKMIKGELDPEKDPRWTVVTNVPNAIIGNFIKSQIEDAGIPVLMMRATSADIAEFSHNDFVPQVLMVPLHLVREARRLVDAPPGDQYGAHFPAEYGEFEEEGNEQPDNEQADELSHGNLPPGWSMLPTEADFQARQNVKRSEGVPDKGWYWSDERPLYEQKPEPNPAGAWDDDPYDSGYAPTGDDYGPYPSRGYYGQARWIRLVYAVLLLVLSLPFLLTILGQIWTLLNNLW